MQPISHRTGQQLHLHVWVFGPHLWHCSMPVFFGFFLGGGGLKATQMVCQSSPTKPFGNSVFHLLAVCLICLHTKRDRDAGWRVKLSAAQVLTQVKKKKKNNSRHMFFSSADKLWCGVRLCSAISCNQKQSLQILTTHSFPQHLGQPYFITFFGATSWEKPCTLAHMCLYEACSCLQAARAG